MERPALPTGSRRAGCFRRLSRLEGVALSSPRAAKRRRDEEREKNEAPATHHPIQEVKAMMEIQACAVEVVDEDQPRYRIGKVAAMVQLHPQTIRYYESIGLISPRRVRGRIRLYSERDVARLRQIVELTQLGVNLAGVEIILRLREQISVLQLEIERLRAILGAESPPPSEPEQL